MPNPYHEMDIVEAVRILREVAMDRDQLERLLVRHTGQETRGSKLIVEAARRLLAEEAGNG